MRGRSGVLRVAAFLLAAVACAREPGASPRAADSDARVLAISESYVADVFEQYPERPTLLRPPGARYDGLPDDSLAGVAARAVRRDGWLAALRAVAPGTLRDPNAVLAHAVVLSRLEDEEAARVCRYELWGVSQMLNGWQVRFSNLAQAQPVGTAAFQEQADARFSKLSGYVDAQSENLREGLRQGYTAPKTVVRLVLEQLGQLAEGRPEASPFASPGLRDPDPAFRERWLALVAGEIQPALERHRAFLETTYLPAARDAVGVAANPQGAACYRAALRVSTTLDVSPEQVRETGRAELARLQGELRALSARSFGNAPVAELLERFRGDPAYRFRDAEDVLDQARAALARADAALPQAFGLLPSKPALLEAIPAFQERTSAPHYLNAALDGSRPAAYRVRLYQPEQQSRVIGESTAFHEVVPGHHLQVNVANDRVELPSAVRFLLFSGFSEGWALYAERLADELGLYSSDADRFGMGSNFAWRAVRLVVDSGLHAFGMSREAAVELLLVNTALSKDQAAAEIDRYIAWPGQASSYMLGYLEIQALRAQAERSLGPAFALREFHDVVLGGGSLPLPVLRARVEAWLAAAQRRASTTIGSPTATGPAATTLQ
jgi:uncharacterized protein (DUF885 family)